jgi:hypothetical protein
MKPGRRIAHQQADTFTKDWRGFTVPRRVRVGMRFIASASGRFHRRETELGETHTKESGKFTLT